MTTFEPSVVELFVGPEARRVDVFDRYTVDLSMLEVGAAFNLSFWYSEASRETPWRALVDRARGVKCGDLVTLAVDGDAVLSGVVETRDVGDEEGRDGPDFMVSGRDLLGGAVSFDADPTLTLAGRRLEDALDALYRGVGVVAEVSESIPPEARVGALRRPRRGAFGRRASRPDLTRVKHPRVGEKVQQVVSRIVRGLGYRVWTTPAENSGRTAVVVDRPRASGEVLFTLSRVLDEDRRVVASSNILGGRERTSIADVPTEVTVFADAPRGDTAGAKIARTVTNGFLLTPEASARVSDDAPPRPRFVESRSARTPEAAHNEAARVCAQANEGFRRYTATVLGHRQNGRLWVPNNRVAVRDDLVGVDETMLLVAVTLDGSKAGSQKTRLTLVPEGALHELPEVEAT